MKSAPISVGQRFGKLVVVARLGLVQEGKIESRKKIGFLCMCDCGETKVAIGYRLVSGHIVSCGCRKKEAALENCQKYGLKPRHGMTDTKIWKTWSSMLDRTRPDARDEYVKQYYSRGITVCERWRTFENFFDDMGHPHDGMSLDRIDNDLGYEPSNCRWATTKQQQNNKTNTRFLIVDGKKRSLMSIANELGIKKSAAQYFFSTYRKLMAEYGSISLEEG